MGEAAKRIATYADLDGVPEHLVAEIVDGELYEFARPSPKHAATHSRLLVWSGSRFDLGDGGPGGWWILTEPELHLHGDALVPDIAGWKKSRMQELPESAYFELAPDWVCEVLSPSTAEHDRIRKMATYAREGVRHAWLLDPQARVLEVYELENGRWYRCAACGGNRLVHVPPFEEIELDLSLLWA